MKCIQAIKETKNIKIGEVKRVSDRDADGEVKSGYWKYISKREWKKLEPNKESESKEEVEKKEKTLSKKAENRYRLKQKQRQ